MTRAQLVRPRLLEPLRSCRLAVVEAPGGYGKTVLAEQLREDLAIPAVGLALRPLDGSEALLPLAVLRALRAARRSDLAASIEGRSDPFEVVDALLSALAATRSPTLLVVDDVHHLRGAALDAIERLACELPEPHRLGLLGRSICSGDDDLGGRHRPARLSGTELAFSAEEIERFLFGAARIRLSDGALATVRVATRGWPAALELWARAIASSEDPEGAVEGLAARRAGLGSLVEALLGELTPDEADTARQLAHLPLLSRQACSEISGSAELFERITEAGLPLVEAGGGWVRFGEAVANHLTSGSTLIPGFARRSAEVYARFAEDGAAISTLLASGLAGEAADAIAVLSPVRRHAVGAATIRAFAAELPDQVLDCRPEVWLQVARASDDDGRWAERREALRRGMAAVSVPQGSPASAELRHALLAEQAFDDLREGRPNEARLLADEVLAASSAVEHAARSKALACAGRLAALGARGDDGFETATRLLQRAAASARRAGDDRWTAGVLLRLADDALRERCRYAEALQAVDEALRLLAGSPRGRALALTARCDTLLDIGRVDEAAAGIAESAQLARTLRDDASAAYASWSELELAVQLDDRRRLLASLERCERHRGDWFSGFSGVGFLTDAADALDRLGLCDEARAYLERARARRQQDERQFSIAEAGIVARSGDPTEGRLLVRAALDQPGLSPRRRWRLVLLDAWAAARSGEEQVPALAAQGFNYCHALGWPRLPFVRERAVAERLLPLAVDAGSHAARSLAEGGRGSKLRCLGDFTLSRAGRTVDLPSGRPTLLVMALVAAGGSSHAEQLIETLWPEASLEAGRGRLRNVLSRLKAEAGSIVERHGELVRFAGEVEVDVEEFESLARAALEAEPRDPGRAAALARDAAALHHGPALEGARYEPWAASLRERVRGLHLALLDLLTRDAERLEQTDEAIRLLERAIEIEPYDEDRYAKAGRLLRSQGRVGSARSMMRRCRGALSELGMEPTLPVWDDFVDDDPRPA